MLVFIILSCMLSALPFRWCSLLYFFFFFLSLTLLILLSSTNQLFSILKVLFRYYPEILTTSPRIGRQGKAFRRQQNQRILESHLQHESTGCPNSLSRESSMKKGNCPTMKSSEAGPDNNKGGSVYFFNLILKWNLCEANRLLGRISSLQGD